MKNESIVQQEVQIEAAKLGCLLERNNSGSFANPYGQQVRFGLGNVSKKHAENMASSDLVGGTSVIITPEMVGTRVLIFTAVEVKEEKWNPQKKFDAHERAQSNWLQWVIARGGIAGFVNSVESLRQLLRR